MGLWYTPWKVPLIALFLSIAIISVSALDFGKRKITLSRMKRGLDARTKMVLPRMRRSSYNPEGVDYNVDNEYEEFEEPKYVLDTMPKRRYIWIS